MAAKRSDCVLVVDEEEHLSGIFTVSIVPHCSLFCVMCGSVDWSFGVPSALSLGKRSCLQSCCFSNGRQVRGWNNTRHKHHISKTVYSHPDFRATTVADIMTRNPMCVTADTSAQDALNLMVSRGFRHLVTNSIEGHMTMQHMLIKQSCSLCATRKEISLDYSISQNVCMKLSTKWSEHTDLHANCTTHWKVLNENGPTVRCNLCSIWRLWEKRCLALTWQQSWTTPILSKSLLRRM